MLMVRSTFYKALGIMLLMCGAQFGMFFFRLQRLAESNRLSLEFTIEKSFIGIFFVAAFIALFLLLSSTGKSKKAKTAYTLNRLQISEDWIFFWQSLYNILCFALLYFIQVIMAMFLCYYYVENSGDSTITDQTVFLAFYRNSFFHSLLPFDEPHSVAANFVTLFIAGTVSALTPMKERHGSGAGIPWYLCFWIVINGFSKEVGDFGMNLVIYAIGVIILGTTIYFLLTKEVHDGN